MQHVVFTKKSLMNTCCKNSCWLAGITSFSPRRCSDSPCILILCLPFDCGILPFLLLLFNRVIICGYQVPHCWHLWRVHTCTVGTVFRVATIIRVAAVFGALKIIFSDLYFLHDNLQVGKNQNKKIWKMFFFALFLAQSQNHRFS